MHSCWRTRVTLSVPKGLCRAEADRAALNPSRRFVSFRMTSFFWRGFLHADTRRSDRDETSGLERRPAAASPLQRTPVHPCGQGTGICGAFHAMEAGDREPTALCVRQRGDYSQRADGLPTDGEELTFPKLRSPIHPRQQHSHVSVASAYLAEVTVGKEHPVQESLDERAVARRAPCAALRDVALYE